MVETPQLGFLLVCTQYILPAAGCSLAPARPPGWSWCPRPGGIVHDRQVITCQLKDVSSIAVSRWTRHCPRPGGIVDQQAGDHLSTLHRGTCHPCSCCCHTVSQPPAMQCTQTVSQPPAAADQLSAPIQSPACSSAIERLHSNKVYFGFKPVLVLQCQTLIR